MSGPFLLWGFEYDRLEELSEQYDIPFTALLKRFRQNKDLEECVLHFLNKKVKSGNTRYVNYTKLGKAYDMLPEIIRARLKEGWAIEKAAIKPRISTKATNPIEYNGVTYNSKLDLCEQLGIASELVYSTQKNYKIPDWLNTFDQILNFLSTCGAGRPTIVSRIPYVIYNDTWYDTAKDFCMACHLPYASYMGGIANVPPNTEPLKIMKKMFCSKKIRGRYPDFTFDPSGFCKNTKRDFKIEMSTFKSKLTD